MQSSRFITFMGLSTILMLSAGCTALDSLLPKANTDSNSNNPPIEKPDDYFPLVEGAWWKYSLFSPSGSSLQKFGDETVTVLSVSTSGDSTTATIQKTRVTKTSGGATNNVVSTSSFIKTASRVYRQNDNNPQEPFLFLPLLAGTSTLEAVEPVASDTYNNSFTEKQLSTSEQSTVALDIGKFVHCYIVSAAYTNNWSSSNFTFKEEISETLTIAPNVGILKRELSDTTTTSGGAYPAPPVTYQEVSQLATYSIPVAAN